MDLRPQHPERLMETHMVLPYVEPVKANKTELSPETSARIAKRQKAAEARIKEQARYPYRQPSYDSAGNIQPFNGSFEQGPVPDAEKVSTEDKTKTTSEDQQKEAPEVQQGDGVKDSPEDPYQDKIETLKQELEEANVDLYKSYEKLEGIVDLFSPKELAQMHAQFKSGQVPETLASFRPHTIDRMKASIEGRCAPKSEKRMAQSQDEEVSELASTEKQPDEEPVKSKKDITVNDFEETAKTLQELKDPSSKQRQELEKKRINLPSLESELDAKGLARLQAQLLVYSSFDLASKDSSTSASSLPRNLVFSSPDHTAHDELDGFVEDVADLTHSNLIRLDANDIAELAGTYVDGGDTSPGSITSLAFDAFEGIGSGEVSRVTFEQVIGTPGPDGAEGEEGEESQSTPRGDYSSFGGLDGLKSIIQANKDILSKALGGKIVGVHIGDSMAMPGSSAQNAQSQPVDKGKSDDVELDPWQELKLETYLDHLLNAVGLKETSDLSNVGENFLREKFPETRTSLSSSVLERTTANMSQDERRRLERLWALPKLAHDSLRLHVVHHVKDIFSTVGNVLAQPKEHHSQIDTPMDGPASGTIIHLRDIDRISETSQGEIAVERLLKVVAQRRKEGQRVLIVGTAAAITGGVLNPTDAEAQAAFQSIPYPSGSSELASSLQATRYKEMAAQKKYPINQGYRRLVELNLRNIQDTIRRLGVPSSDSLFTEDSRKYIFLPGTHKLGEDVMTPEEIERLVLFANGLRTLYTSSVQESQAMYSSSNEKLELIHIAISLSLIDRIEHSVSMGKNLTPENIYNSIQVQELPTKNKKEGAKRPNIEKIKKSASKHEQRLLTGVADPASIKVGFDDVHVQPETIEALKTITSLSLLRPEAFSYGVLAKDRLTGLLLYGPPGTGKTLLAKAVAKESGATVMEVSGAQIYEKYVGEGEKNVRAVFSLARKLSPCVVFIDEADAIFSSRGSSSNRTTHREIINQFLREWDGMDDQGVFMMVATNRPFDLDDAVLRRLPRRVLVDLPVAKDRESILRIHLKEETLESDVELPKLAERTPFYSGSDLKNLCVAAALNAVREENELLEQKKRDNVEDFKLPERRTLSQRHFDKAIQEISASISEDMSSLNAIKKFDEQYGDRRGRKKKSGYGFGLGSGEPDENDVRVRGDRDRDGPRP